MINILNLGHNGGINNEVYDDYYINESNILNLGYDNKMNDEIYNDYYTNNLEYLLNEQSKYNMYEYNYKNEQYTITNEGYYTNTDDYYGENLFLNDINNYTSKDSYCLNIDNEKIYNKNDSYNDYSDNDNNNNNNYMVKYNPNNIDEQEKIYNNTPSDNMVFKFKNFYKSKLNNSFDNDNNNNNNNKRKVNNNQKKSNNSNVNNRCENGNNRIIKKIKQYNLNHDDVGLFFENSLQYIYEYDNGNTIVKFKCKICNIIFNLMMELKSHFIKHFKQILYFCRYDNCYKFFISIKDLDIHEIKHSSCKKIDMDENRNKCAICNRKLSSKIALKKHIKTHYRMISYSCNICDKMFGTKKMLDMHNIEHDETKKIYCLLCGKMYPDKYYLNQHLKMGHHIR